MLFALLALAGIAGYHSWNHRSPTSGARRLRRAGFLALVVGAVAMPWMWWSGLPEAALAAGAVTLLISVRRTEPPDTTTDQEPATPQLPTSPSSG
jgi:hypothetical protein